MAIGSRPTTPATETTAPSADFATPRSSRRWPSAMVPSITGLRFSPQGVTATLVNISETGLLADCSERLKPGTVLTVIFEGAQKLKSVPGRVARANVSSMDADRHLHYHVGIVFSRAIPLDEEMGTVEAPAAPEPEPPSVAAVPRLVRNRW